MNENKHLLVILPHPDDESFATAGTICHYKELGYRVTYICLTMGEMGRNLGNPPIANRENLAEIRKRELEKACEVLEIDQLIFYGLRDKTIEFEDEEQLAQRMKATIEELQPSVIISFYPGYSIHPDHDACGAIVYRAVSLIPREKRPLLYMMAITRDCFEKLGKPDVSHYVKKYSEKKLLALKAHKTQMQEVVAVMEMNLKEGNRKNDEWFHFENFWKID